MTASGATSTLAAVLATALALSACSILPERETLVLYQLPSAAAMQSASAPSAAPAQRQPAVSLRVATPYSSQVIDSRRVLVIPEGSQVSAYAGIRWSDRAPVLLRDQLADAFRSTGRLRAVSVPEGSGGMDSDIELASSLGAFQVVYEHGAPVVHIRYDATLVRLDGHRSIATRRFMVTEPVQGKQGPEVVQAFGRAADRLSSQVLDWAMPQLEAARGPNDGH